MAFFPKYKIGRNFLSNGPNSFGRSVHMFSSFILDNHMFGLSKPNIIFALFWFQNFKSKFATFYDAYGVQSGAICIIGLFKPITKMDQTHPGAIQTYLWNGNPMKTDDSSISWKISIFIFLRKCCFFCFKKHQNEQFSKYHKFFFFSSIYSRRAVQISTFVWISVLGAQC